MRTSKSYMLLSPPDEHFPQGRWFADMQDPRSTRLYGKEDMYQVQVTELPEPVDGCYWAWWNQDIQDYWAHLGVSPHFEYIFPVKGGVEMCFPYGTRPEQDRGRGFLLPVKIEIIKKIEEY